MPSSTRLSGTLAALVLLAPGRPLTADPGDWLGSWQPLGPEGAQVQRILPHPTDPDLLYARTREAVLRSDDGGATWRDVSPVFPLDPFADLAVDPRDPDRLYTGGTAPSTLLESTDGGATWTAAGRGLPCCLPCCTRIETLLVDPSDPDVVYAGILNTPVFKSTDGGERFAVAGRGQPERGSGMIAIDPSDTRVLYTASAAHTSGFGGFTTFEFFRSADRGARWQPLGSFAVFGFDGLQALAVDPGDPARLYALTTGGVWASGDGGRSWQRTASPGLMTAFALDPGGEGLLYAGDAAGRIFLSPNDGESWLPMGSGQPGSHVLDLAPVPAALLEPFTPTLYAGTFDGGAHRLDVTRDAPCLPDATTLCLLDGRFRAEALFSHRRRGGAGQADPLGDRAGTFSFFEQGRPDLFTKLLDGSGVNGWFWVFFGGLTHVEHHLFVSDSATGRMRAYAHPSGSFASGGDVRAFPAAEPAGSPVAAAPDLDDRASTAPFVLPLAGGRFEVTLFWRPPGRPFRSARGAVLPGGESGYFWFSTPDNPELVVKLVDARALVDAFWLFHAGLSNLAYTLIVTDTVEGTTRTFEHPAGGFASGRLVLPD